MAQYLKMVQYPRNFRVIANVNMCTCVHMSRVQELSAVAGSASLKKQSRKLGDGLADLIEREEWAQQCLRTEVRHCDMFWAKLNLHRTDCCLIGRARRPMYLFTNGLGSFQVARNGQRGFQKRLSREIISNCTESFQMSRLSSMAKYILKRRIMRYMKTLLMLFPNARKAHQPHGRRAGQNKFASAAHSPTADANIQIVTLHILNIPVQIAEAHTQQITWSRKQNAVVRPRRKAYLFRNIRKAHESTSNTIYNLQKLNPHTNSNFSHS